MGGQPVRRDYGKAKLYEVYSWSGVATGQKVHESRLIVFPGRRVTERNPTENEGWGDSVLALVYDVLRNFNQAWLGAGYTLNDFSVAIMKIKGLAAVLAQTIRMMLQPVPKRSSLAVPSQNHPARRRRRVRAQDHLPCGNARSPRQVQRARLRHQCR